MKLSFLLFGVLSGFCSSQNVRVRSDVTDELQLESENDWETMYENLVTDETSFMAFCYKMCETYYEGENCNDECKRMWEYASSENALPTVADVETCM